MKEGINYFDLTWDLPNIIVGFRPSLQDQRDHALVLFDKMMREKSGLKLRSSKSSSSKCMPDSSFLWRNTK